MNGRRSFLKLSGMAGMGMALGHTQAATLSTAPSPPPADRFNMCGYAAPALETVRVGIIGLGNRGPGAVEQLSKIDGVDIRALCDLRREKAEEALQLLQHTPHKPELYTGTEDAWKKLCDRDDLDLIYVATPWHLHARMAAQVMESGKHAAVEVPAAITLDECWNLVRTSERTRKHCIILENCCYDFFELLTLNMARQGFFGEIIHCEGAYIHDLLEPNFLKDNYHNMWRLKQNMRNGNLYPTHGAGPVSQIMNINRGDRFDYLVSVSSNDFMMSAKAMEMADQDAFYKPFANSRFRGNINTTTIRTVKGRTMMLQHDVTSPRPYSRIHLVSGTKGIAQKYPLPARIARTHERWLTEEEFKKLEAQYLPDIVKKIGAMAKQVEGHGGMDFLMNWRLIDCLRNGLPVEMDVYDAATWSAIAPLSEKSVANRAATLDFPDFTQGSWKTNLPVMPTLEKGGNTKTLL